LPEPTRLQILKTIWADSDAWPEFVEVMLRSIVSDAPSENELRKSSKIDWLQIPTLCCEAAGGNPDQAHIVSVAWGLLYTAAHLMDIVEDQDEMPGWMLQLGSGPIVNIATGLYASSALAIGKKNGVAPELVTKLYQSFNRTILQMCSGQHLDLTGSLPSLEVCWHVVEAKSGALFELACASGASLATDDPQLISKFGEFGKQLGIVLQICDDVSEIWGGRVKELIKLNFYSIPIAYTMNVLPNAERQEFREYVEHSNKDTHSAKMVRGMIEQAGAVLYVKMKFQYHCQQAIKALRATDTGSLIYENLVKYVDQLDLMI